MWRKYTFFLNLILLFSTLISWKTTSNSQLRLYRSGTGLCSRWSRCGKHNITWFIRKNSVSSAFAEVEWIKKRRTRHRSFATRIWSDWIEWPPLIFGIHHCLNAQYLLCEKWLLPSCTSKIISFTICTQKINTITHRYMRCKIITEEYIVPFSRWYASCQPFFRFYVVQWPLRSYFLQLPVGSYDLHQPFFGFYHALFSYWKYFANSFERLMYVVCDNSDGKFSKNFLGSFPAQREVRMKNEL